MGLLFYSFNFALTLALCQGTFLVTTPRKWISGAQSQMCVMLIEGTFGPTDFLSFTFDPVDFNPALVTSIDTLQLPQGQSSACLSFDVPKTSSGRGKIDLSGNLAGADLMETFNVSIANSADKAFIQTDKYRYKPGQDVQFRLLALSGGPFQRVLKDQYEEIYVENPTRTRIQQWNNIANPTGLVHLSFKLSEEPEEGTYHIYASTGRGSSHSTSFKVEDYVLPRFEVTIKPVGVMLGNDTQVTIELCARYTFGQPVQGTGYLSVAIGRFRTYANITQEKPINGCEKYVFDTKQLRFDDNNCHIRINNLKADAKVVERGTGTELYGQNYNMPVHRRTVKFNDVSPMGVQKRYLPVLSNIEATYNDDSPATNEPVSVCTYYNNENVCKNMTTDSAGKLTFVTTNQISRNIVITATNHPKIERNFNDVMKESQTYSYPYRSERYTEAHNASLTIFTNEKLNCTHGDDIHVNVPLIYIYDTPETSAVDVNIQVMSRGQIQYFDKMRVPLVRTATPFDNVPFLIKEDNIPKEVIVGQYDFPVTLPSSVSPKLQIVAWFAKSDGSVIADSKGLDVSLCLNHKVHMSWSVAKGEPGSQAQLKLTGAPGGICSYGVVDKSVELLPNPSDQLTVKQLLNTLSYLSPYRWDGSVQLDLNFCLKKYNRTVDIPPIEEEKPEPLEPVSAQTISPSKTSLPPQPTLLKPLRSVSKPLPIVGTRPIGILPIAPVAAVEPLQPVIEDPLPPLRSLPVDVIPAAETPLQDDSRTVLKPFDSLPLVRRKRSFVRPPLRGTEMEAAHIFRKAGYFVFSDVGLDLESQFCNDVIDREIKNIILQKQQMEKPVISNKISGGGGGGTADRISAFSAASRPRPPLQHAAPVAQEISAAGFAAQSDSASEGATRERVYFPETWLWDLIDLSASNGEATKTLTLPDTITEWVGKAVCLHSDKGIGLSPTASITTFTSFFVDLTLPPNIKRGEILPVKISVFNYLDHELPVEVILEKSADHEFNPRQEKGVRRLCIPPNGQITETIKIQPVTIGDVNITVDAAVSASNKCGPPNPTYKSDRIIRSLPVEAEGFIRELVTSQYVCSQDLLEDPIESISLEVPTGIVAGSERGYFTVVGDLLGPTAENLNNLVNLPYGCGEQNMIRFAPNIFILRYLRVKNEASDIQMEARRFMQIGYQRQLTFRRREGAFSTFGNLDKNGSTWLTAFVVKSFSQASPFITIDNKIVDSAIEWLKMRQDPVDGCFRSEGRVVNKRMLGGLKGKSSLLTAYVLVALLEAGEKTSSKTIQDAIRCVNNDISTHSYDLALKAYSLALAGVPEASAVVEELITKASANISQMNWPIPDLRNRALHIETTAYALLALLASDPVAYKQESRKIVRWLSARRNAFGGFASTQDTVVALQALAAFEEAQPTSVLNLQVSAESGTNSQIFSVTKENKLLQQRETIATFPADVRLAMTGTGCALVQGVLRYNVLSEDKDNAFNLLVTIEPVEGDCAARNIRACVSYTLSDGESNMAVLEATVLSGYTPRKADLKSATEQETVKRYEVDGSKINFYLEQVSAEEICVNFRVYRDIVIDNLQDRHIKVYDYYQPEYVKEQKYNFNLSSTCTS